MSVDTGGVEYILAHLYFIIITNGKKLHTFKCINWNAHDTLLREESKLQNTQYIIGELKKNVNM